MQGLLLSTRDVRAAAALRANQAGDAEPQIPAAPLLHVQSAYEDGGWLGIRQTGVAVRKGVGRWRSVESGVATVVLLMVRNGEVRTKAVARRMGSEAD